MNNLNKLPPGWHVPERSEGRGLWGHHALRSSGRATQLTNLFLGEAKVALSPRTVHYHHLQTQRSPNPFFGASRYLCQNSTC